MLFNSPQFLVFFAVVTVLYFTIPRRLQWVLLLLASCYFYMAFIPAYILILGFTIAVDYCAGLLIESSADRWREPLLVASLAANIGVLAIFKYAGWLEGNLASAARLLDWNYPLPVLAIVLPIGLSFHTFQSLSYTIEVYRRRQRAERHPGIFALYVMFYPQLVAGPIERPQNLLHQLKAPHGFDYPRITGGLEQMALGFFKKMVIADRLALLVNPIFDHPSSYDGIGLSLAVLGFAYQIYCDFSGYSDIALGAAQVMGIDLMQNFNRPYAARSIAEFWSRWHISLSTWFRDYLYIPLGGNRVSALRWVVNVLITFLVSGLWHGANWTFVIWGGLHGTYYLCSGGARAVARRVGIDRAAEAHARVAHATQVVTTFCLVSFAWIFFRARSVADGGYIASHLLSVHWPPHLVLPIAREDLALLSLFIVMLEAAQWLQSRYPLRESLAARPAIIRWGLYYVLVMTILLAGVFSRQEFIYFQF